MRPLFLLHGFTGSAESFRFVTALLDAPLVLAPALTGHGAESDAADFDAEIERLAQIASTLPAPAHLAGYSLGARVGLGLLLCHPELFASATLIGVHPGLSHPTERAARRLGDESWCALLEREGLAAFVAAWQAQPLLATQARLPRAVRDAERAIRLSHTALGLARSLRATGLAAMPSYAARLHEIRTPVEVLVGGLDRKFHALPHPGTRQVVAGAGHNLLIECPDAVARAIARGART